MLKQKLFQTNLFDEPEVYARNRFWVSFNGDSEKQYQFRELCSEEKIEVDLEETKKAKNEHRDERLVFKKYVPKSKLLFILFLMDLYRAENTSN